MRVFTVVGRPRLRRRGAARSRRRPPPRARARRPRPRRRHRRAPPRPPSARTFAATLPAPPTWKLSRSTSTTGTGASGEMRDTRPHRNSSSITSPTTSTRRPRIAETMARARAGERGLTRREPPRGRAARRANGTAVTSRTSISTSESPRLYSNEPRDEDRRQHRQGTGRGRRRARPRGPGRRARARRASSSATASAAANHQRKKTRPGTPRSAAICSGLLCRCGAVRVRRLGPAVARVDRRGSCPGPGRTRAGRGSCRARPATCSSGRCCSRRGR